MDLPDWNVYVPNEFAPKNILGVYGFKVAGIFQVQKTWGVVFPTQKIINILIWWGTINKPRL